MPTKSPIPVYQASPFRQDARALIARIGTTFNRTKREALLLEVLSCAQEALSEGRCQDAKFLFRGLIDLKCREKSESIYLRIGPAGFGMARALECWGYHDLKAADEQLRIVGPLINGFFKRANKTIRIECTPLVAAYQNLLAAWAFEYFFQASMASYSFRNFHSQIGNSWNSTLELREGGSRVGLPLSDIRNNAIMLFRSFYRLSRGQSTPLKEDFAEAFESLKRYGFNPKIQIYRKCNQMISRFLRYRDHYGGIQKIPVSLKDNWVRKFQDIVFLPVGDRVDAQDEEKEQRRRSPLEVSLASCS